MKVPTVKLSNKDLIIFILKFLYVYYFQLVAKKIFKKRKFYLKVKRKILANNYSEGTEHFRIFKYEQI